MKKLLLGTYNKNKIDHYKKFLSGAACEILTLDDLGINDGPEETGKTLEENARIKAEYYFRRTRLPTLADDAGFEIPALGNFPGVKSGRFAGSGRRMSDQEVIEGILEKMKDLKRDDRKARMKVVEALMLDRDTVHISSGAIEGVVPEKPFEKNLKNFPYRSLLYVTALNKWFYDVTEADEERLGYRKAAIEQLKKYLV